MRTTKWALCLCRAALLLSFLFCVVAAADADDFTVVPEPASILLLVTGLAGLGGYAVYKKIKK